MLRVPGWTSHDRPLVVTDEPPFCRLLSYRRASVRQHAREIKRDQQSTHDTSNTRDDWRRPRFQ